ncbi:hypothetical protein BDK51DRAFT_51043, partial [Blyttiomyces helicus]
MSWQGATANGHPGDHGTPPPPFPHQQLQQPPAAAPAPAPAKPQYLEFKLTSSATNLSHHIMKFSNPKLDVAALPRPLRMVRDIPPPSQAKLEYEAERAALVLDAKAADAAAEKRALMEKLDPGKIAPFGNAVKNRTNLFKKKTKSFYFGRDEEAEEEAKQAGKDGAAPRRRKKDPDRFPWLLTDAEGNNGHVGNVDGAQDSNYYLFVFSDDGFQVIPASKWYKFTPKLNYRTLTAEEADEQLKNVSKTKHTDRWLMHRKKEVRLRL